MKAKYNLNHWDSPYPQDLLEKRILNGIVYKIMSNDDFMGSFILEEEYPPPYIDSMSIDDIPFRYLTRLAVFPDHQLSGIGSWALRESEKIAKTSGAKIMRLDILAHYTQLAHFYEKNGYSKIGTGQTRRFTIAFYEKLI
jgi:GNAT superfamily N-acetyltransferase